MGRPIYEVVEKVAVTCTESPTIRIAPYFIRKEGLKNIRNTERNQ